jgi:hypothetical protein
MIDIGDANMKQVFDGLKVFGEISILGVSKARMVVYNGMTEIKHWRFSSAYCKYSQP